ncbi:MAG: 3-hydroxyacyl-CoA dehydrogenase family protein [Desulfarculaceae bacterium]|nr:3-hydroxyacyl-CoA dehydrogenase family protein [Desulfarculaceae bacterium]MCF8072888.1 3-hydroxyacyl-CoA dehydrogenase family protein [Desulfarculaceae bacterium]MCF8101056.1 3-hydroxyacyl-CoA dehydrogenase family protein [Desulfarculaceae bacterium]MCF8115557.1 3-hydroxyacyl-CoA dehydrogenase family protein [Desulfarculaceae bacterium]
MNLEQVKRIAVIGLGTMGPGLVLAFAQKGYPVMGFDPQPGAAELCDSTIAGTLENLVELDGLDPAEAAKARGRVAYANTLAEAVDGADIVVEAVSENRDIKKEVFAQIEAAAPAHALLWSNTSTLNIYPLVPEALLPRSIIAHWFAPPHIIPLVEVVKDPGVDPATVELTLAVLQKLGKLAIEIERYVPGFVINRLQRHLNREVFFLLEQGYVSPEDLDLAVKASVAPRMMLLGLAQRVDFTGLDLSARNLLDEEFFDPPIDNHPKALYEHIDKGELGAKSGKGFYDYGGRPPAEIYKERDRYMLKIMQNLKFCLEKKRLV